VHLLFKIIFQFYVTELKQEYVYANTLAKRYQISFRFKYFEQTQFIYSSLQWKGKICSLVFSDPKNLFGNTVPLSKEIVIIVYVLQNDILISTNIQAI